MYLRDLGVRLGTFPYTFEDTFIRGFAVLVTVLGSNWILDALSLIALPFLPMVVFVLVLGAILFTISAIKQRKWPNIKKQYISEISRISSSTVRKTVIYGAGKLIAILCVGAFIGYFLLALVTTAIRKGENDAAEIKRAFDGKAQSGHGTINLPKQLIVYRDVSEKKPIKVSGIIAASSDSYFVIYTSTGLTIIPKDRLESIVMFKESGG